MGAPKLTSLELVGDREEVKTKSSQPTDELSKYFYKISNHEELFQMGIGFLNEVRKGTKSFAFTSTGYKNSQQRTILGLCCFFDQSDDYKIAIVSDHMSLGVFNDLYLTSVIKQHSLINEGHLEYHSFYHHFDFINYDDLMKIPNKTFDLEVKSLLNKYDIILWDIPEMEKMKSNQHFHYKISHFYESMTVIVSQSMSSGKQVDSIKKFFSNYNINLNGVLFDTGSSGPEKTRKKFLGIF